MFCNQTTNKHKFVAVKYVFYRNIKRLKAYFEKTATGKIVI